MEKSPTELEYPLVSIIVPLKNSGDNIKTIVDTLLMQDYKNLEILLIDDEKNHCSSQFLNLPVKFVKTIPFTGKGRDANYKRNVGIQNAKGSVTVFTDQDCILPPTWISQMIFHLKTHRVHAVGGQVIGTGDGLLSDYYDNTIIPKVPKFNINSKITKSNFGSTKIPTTANLCILTDALKSIGGFDENFTIDYEDYEILWRFVKKGYAILCTPRSFVEHPHPKRLRDAIKHYQRSGIGCAQFMMKHRDSPLTKRRAIQVIETFTLPPLLLVLLFQYALAPAILAAAIASYCCIMALKVRKLYGLLFPFIDLLLGYTFTVSILRGLVKFKFRRSEN